MKVLQQLVQRYLDGCVWGQHQTAATFAPANIALCKYWGKRDRIRNLPVTDSLSISLGTYGSHCQLKLVDHADSYRLNGTALSADSPFAIRLRAFLDLFRGPQGYCYQVDAVNTVATAAGFASSASGFAALVMALDQLHGWSKSKEELSRIARLGSGSACRSMWHGFVHWHAGCDPDGMDSVAEWLPITWQSLRVGLLPIACEAKPVSSREAMNRTVATSCLYEGWSAQVAADLTSMRAALEAQAFERLGACAEENALAMHATMISARPPVLYWHPDTVAVMQAVWRARADGIPVYFTMDAGPNVKLLFEVSQLQAVEAAFPDVMIANPWSTT